MRLFKASFQWRREAFELNYQNILAVQQTQIQYNEIDKLESSGWVDMNERKEEIRKEGGREREGERLE